MIKIQRIDFYSEKDLVTVYYKVEGMRNLKIISMLVFKDILDINKLKKQLES